jgi:hypothetical protein
MFIWVEMEKLCQRYFLTRHQKSGLEEQFFGYWRSLYLAQSLLLQLAFDKI